MRARTCRGVASALGTGEPRWFDEGDTRWDKSVGVEAGVRVAEDPLELEDREARLASRDPPDRPVPEAPRGSKGGRGLEGLRGRKVSAAPTVRGFMRP